MTPMNNADYLTRLEHADELEALKAAKKLPYKGNTDPILYRLHEVIDTYGPAIKDIIHEQGGNAIMSAIDFGLDVDVTEDAEGNHRVIIKFDGKLLPYAKKGKYPW